MVQPTTEHLKSRPQVPLPRHVPLISAHAESGRQQDAGLSPVGTFGHRTKPLPLRCRAQLASSPLLPPRVGDTFLNLPAGSVWGWQEGGGSAGDGEDRCLGEEGERKY